MLERRREPRLLCADLVEIEWKDKSGRPRRAVANLEDISPCGACLQMDSALPLHSLVNITYGNGRLTGSVRYCVYREIGYYLGIQFDEGTRWTRRAFKPQYLFDPRRLLSKSGRAMHASSR